MTESKPTYTTTTPPPRFAFGTLTLEGLAATFTAYSSTRRDAIMRELVEIEKNLGYGKKDKPTTAHLRGLWRKWRGRCPHCGKGLE